MKKLIINAIPLLGEMSGIGRYIHNIVKEFEKEKNLEITYYYGYFSKKLLVKNYMANKTAKKVLKFTLIKKVIKKILFLRTKLSFKTFDLYWEPNFIPLTSIKSKKIVTSVHDFSFDIYKDFHPKERVDYFEKYFHKNIKLSEKIICFSNYTKSEIVEKLNIPKDKVKVIYHGIDHNIFRVIENPKVDFELPKKFILSVGSIEPRKNLIGLLKAYNLLPEDIKNSYKLILVGFSGWKNREIMDEINKNKNIIYLGYLSDEDLAKVYNLASLFVYPSFYEGFGFPPLEAMACGTPILISNKSSLPEVGADAAIYCEPNDINDIKDKIIKILSDDKLKTTMIEKGLKQAQKFTWEKSAKEHLELFKEVI